MDKIILKFVADLLYCKEILYFDEYEDIMNACNADDLDNIIDKMLRGDFNVYLRGESIPRDGER